MTYNPKWPIGLPDDSESEPLEPLHYEHERPKPPYTGALALVCMMVALPLVVWLAWLVSKW